MGKGKGGPTEQVQQAAAQASQVGAEAARQGVQLGKEAFGLGREPFQAGTEYFQTLLGGGQPARVAVGPIADEISLAHQASAQGIEQNLPRGGERNLALAQGEVQRASDISRLYAGVQPGAAGALIQASGIPFGVSTGQIGAGTSGLSAIGPALSFGLGQQQLAAQGAAGVGSLLFKVGTKGKGGGK